MTRYKAGDVRDDGDIQGSDGRRIIFEGEVWIESSQLDKALAAGWTLKKDAPFDQWCVVVQKGNTRQWRIE